MGYSGVDAAESQCLPASLAVTAHHDVHAVPLRQSDKVIHKPYQTQVHQAKIPGIPALGKPFGIILQGTVVQVLIILFRGSVLHAVRIDIHSDKALGGIKAGILLFALCSHFGNVGCPVRLNPYGQGTSPGSYRDAYIGIHREAIVHGQFHMPADNFADIILIRLNRIHLHRHFAPTHL